ncbi:hypothetical protein [Chengkuizengella axinellae]|uniref:DUF5668 domain-containing protein n=1 Tax=Chengkuizengella axinellae TaxID=3064388 RepID=A0ABT9J166_9BACL|nr:hypothetical protein [Chengkuizengella sp. 2205SS18-9]MDP5275337.1 hypothetical protein [Chengkuizengella sp. 2205SS18-9]
MKQWRVGTLSMACSLILLGIVLFSSQIWDYDLIDVVFTWWPLIIILIGLEILIYLFISKKENSVVKYDVFSILFIGFIGTLCIMLFIFTSTGLIEEVRYVINEVESNQELPEVEESLSDEINRVVLQTKHSYYHSIQIDSTKESQLNIFGNAFIRSADEEIKIESDDYVSLNTVGDTLYISLKTPPRKNGFASEYFYMEVTLVLPEDIKVEMDARQQNVVLLTESEIENWDIVMMNKE